MRKNKIISIVIPTYNRVDRLERLLDSIAQSEREDYLFEVLVIDDASPDNTAAKIAGKYPHINIIRNETERNLAGARNVGFRAAQGDYIFTVDDDNVLDKRCIVELAGFAARAEKGKIGMIVPFMCYLHDKERIWSAGARISPRLFTPLIFGNTLLKDATDTCECQTAPNAFMLTREALGEVGLFDEKNFPIHHSEADYGIRLREAGFSCMAIKKAITYHDIGLELPFDLQLRHIKRPYNIMVGEVTLRKKWERSLFWRIAIPLMILGGMLWVVVKNTHLERSQKMPYMWASVRGYLAGQRQRLQKEEYLG